MARTTNCNTVDEMWDGWKGLSPLFIGLGIFGIIAVITSLVAAIVGLAAAIGPASVSPVTMGIAATALLVGASSLLAIMVRAREYFFDHRLVCVREDQCALGMVESLENDADGDTAINLILAPADFEDTSFTDYNSSAQGRLVFGLDQVTGNELQQVKDLRDKRGWSIVPTANRPDFPGARTWGLANLPLFHTEIEGTKFDDWTNAIIAYLTSVIGLAIILIGLAAAALALGPIGWIIIGVIALLIFLALLFGIDITGDEGADAADPTAYPSATPGPSGPILTGDNTEIKLNDFVVIYGRYVIDTGHNSDCWCELHPVRAVAKVEKEIYTNFPPEIDSPIDNKSSRLAEYCEALKRFARERGKLLTAVPLEHEKMG
jgi:hypothetical protein